MLLVLIYLILLSLLYIHYILYKDYDLNLYSIIITLICIFLISIVNTTRNVVNGLFRGYWSLCWCRRNIGRMFLFSSCISGFILVGVSRLMMGLIGLFSSTWSISTAISITEELVYAISPRTISALAKIFASSESFLDFLMMLVIAHALIRVLPSCLPLQSNHLSKVICCHF